jgi:hypothetical protein
MWKWFNCYLSGRHDFGMWCESGEIFLRCVHCGKRSSGWSVDQKLQQKVQKAPTVRTAVVRAATHDSRVLPFGRVAAR